MFVGLGASDQVATQCDKLLQSLLPTKVAALNAQGFGLIPQAHACDTCDYGTFEPELTELFEIGSKNVLLDGALQINGAIFQTTTEDFLLVF